MRFEISFYKRTGKAEFEYEGRESSPQAGKSRFLQCFNV